MELDSVVQATEAATSEILACAEHIQEMAWTMREQGVDEYSHRAGRSRFAVRSVPLGSGLFWTRIVGSSPLIPTGIAPAIQRKPARICPL